MNRILLLMLFVTASHPAYVQTTRTVFKNTDPKGFLVWNAAHVKEVSDRLERELGDRATVSEPVGNWEGHSVYLVLRGKTANAELHETEEDIYIVQRGHGMLVLGGEMVDPEKRPRRQTRSASIRGGTQTDMRPGDILHIPRAIPHQILVAPGERFMYLLFKLDEEPLER